jgi:hypothetical protein
MVRFAKRVDIFADCNVLITNSSDIFAYHYVIVANRVDIFAYCNVIVANGLVYYQKTTVVHTKTSVLIVYWVVNIAKPK